MSSNTFVFNFSFNSSNNWKEEVFIDGYVEGEYRNNFDSFNKEKPLSPFVYGEWMQIEILPNKLKVTTDMLGFYRVYYYLDNDNLLISNAFDTLVVYLKQRGVDLTPNEVVCNLAFNIKDSYFNNLFSEDTFCKQIKTLEPGEVIFFENDVCKIQKSNVYEVIGKSYEDSSYEVLLQRGITYFNDLLDNFLKNGRKVDLHLSGGYDSRACLALLLNRLSPSKINITTARPHKGLGKTVRDIIERDYIIACSISKRYGLPFFTKQHEISFRYGYSINLMDLNKFINNNYFSVAITSKRILDDFSSIEVRGGAGELVRGSAYLNRYKDVLIGKEDTVFFDLEVVFDGLNKNDEYIGEAEKAYYFHENSRYPGSNIFEKFDYRFLNSRNNRHFGHHRRSYSEGNHTLMPLVNPYFLLASRKLTYTQRKSGKLVLDLIAMTFPDLLDIPFADNFSDFTGMLSLAECFEYQGENIDSIRPIISVANKEGMNTETLLQSLLYMAKRATFHQRDNPKMKKMFENIKIKIEESQKFDSVMHNKLLSFLSIFEPNYTGFSVYKR